MNVTPVSSIILTSSGQTSVKWKSLIPKTPTAGILKCLNPLGITLISMWCELYRLFSWTQPVPISPDILRQLKWNHFVPRLTVYHVKYHPELFGEIPADSLPD